MAGIYCLGYRAERLTRQADRRDDLADDHGDFQDPVAVAVRLGADGDYLAAMLPDGCLTDRWLTSRPDSRVRRPFAPVATQEMQKARSSRARTLPFLFYPFQFNTER